ncbi:MAG: hypothetical protein CMO80_05050 [Verrucomicrobiales bacterium]|nr:hypothetical protein [Verrucomicrobiales bacterium]
MEISRFNRRAFLQGIGASLALPGLELFRPSTQAAVRASATTASGAPLRMAFLYIPNGVIMDKWSPQGEGGDFQLNRTMLPLSPHKDRLQVFSGLEHNHGWGHKDGAGDHARANATILTGAHAYKTAGADIKLGISVDQVAAKAVGGETRFSSLELSTDAVRKSGACDSGYSCAYQFNLSWRNEVTPMAPEHNPRLVFERLFGTGNAKERSKNLKDRVAQQKSLLDFVMADAKALNAQLGRNDQQKLDEYLAGVREIERRIEKAEQFGERPTPNMPVPAGVPDSYQEHIRLMMDLMVLAFETDSTRIATFALAHDGSNRRFPEIGVPEPHHGMSHHRNDAQTMRQIARVDKFYTEQFKYYLDKLSSVKDVDGKSLLENSMTVYASGLSDGNRHSHRDLPVILAGNAGGALTSGRHVRFRHDVPMSNLYVNMLNIMGVSTKRFGDSTGALRSV